jgi:hypothetical protein
MHVVKQVKPCTLVRGLPVYDLVEFDAIFCVFNISIFNLRWQYAQMKHDVFLPGTCNSRAYFCVMKHCRKIGL